MRGFASTLRTTQAGPRSENAVLRAHPEARFERFALTPVQHAYLVGRDETLVLGGIGANFYLELMVTVSIMSAGRTRGGAWQSATTCCESRSGTDASKWSNR